MNTIIQFICMIVNSCFAVSTPGLSVPIALQDPVYVPLGEAKFSRLHLKAVPPPITMSEANRMFVALWCATTSVACASLVALVYIMGVA